MCFWMSVQENMHQYITHEKFDFTLYQWLFSLLCTQFVQYVEIFYTMLKRILILDVIHKGNMCMSHWNLAVTFSFKTTKATLQHSGVYTILLCS